MAESRHLNPNPQAAVNMGAPGSLYRRAGLTCSLLIILAAMLGASPVTHPPPSPSVSDHNPKENIPLFPPSFFLLSAAPKAPYLVVDTAQNRIYLRSGHRTVYSAPASTGSGARLQDPRNADNGWVFKTPRGVFTISSKIKNPTWKKPDWAFIEEGRSVPTNVKGRIESGVLGQYAMGFGKGFFIHGTLYTRTLGTNVTHGCIRLGDEPLQYLFGQVSLGTTLIIF